MSNKGSSFPRVALRKVAPAQQIERAFGAREVWHLSLEDVESQTGRVLKREHCPADSLKPSKIWFDTENVLYSKLRPYLNKVVVPDAPGAATSELIPLRPDSSLLDREFLACYLRSPEFVDFANRNTQGANLPRVSMTEFWKYEVPLPPLKEQRRIVARIQECVSRVEEMERMNVAQELSFVDLKRALVFGEPGESSQWGTVKHSTKWIQETEKVRQGEKYQFAGVKSFGRGVFSSAQKTSDDFEYGQLRRLKTNDFIYPKLMAWEGAFGMVPEVLSGMVVSPEFVVFRTDESRLLPEVLDTYFRSPACLPEVNAASTGSNRRRRRLNPKAFLELRVPVPPMARQMKLREVYRLESEMLGDVESTKSELRSLRNTILRQAFAGEL